MNPKPTAGLHHVTAIASDPVANLRFYRDTLGLRLVKKTVNFDDPSTYHFYFGDEAGQPGTLLTFFPWRGLPKARPGNGVSTLTRFAVPAGSLGAWAAHLAAQGVAFARETRFGGESLAFADPDGLGLALVERAVPAEGRRIAGIEGVVLQVGDALPTRGLLLDMGYVPLATEGPVERLQAPGDAPWGRHVDLDLRPGAALARPGAGSVHHIAFRAVGSLHQADFRALAKRHRLQPSPVMDRQYFESIYFREPNGILFEVATDAPGFAIDEAPEHLGESLKLPPGLEARRQEIEASLPTL
jgi:glyoxalase family protein